MHALGREEIEGMKKWKELTLRIRVRRCYKSGRKLGRVKLKRGKLVTGNLP